MTISWYGQTCFKLTSSKGKDSQVDIIIDPLKEGTGLRNPKMEADIIISTEEERKGLSGGFLVLGPGEYDIKDVYIHGLSSGNNNVIYIIDTEGIRICHLGLFTGTELSPDQLEKIGSVDILMVAVGHDQKQAIKVMSQIEPKITIPMYYHIPGLKVKLDGLDKFSKDLGIKALESLPKLSIKKKDIAEEEAKVIALQV